MAKVKAPLFSFEARGKLNDSLVYFPWKGVDAVRSYVIPANPKTASQTTQRGFMTSAVGEWHNATYTALDRSAFNRWAGVLAQIMSGFNAMVKKFIDEAILTNTWERIREVVASAITGVTFTVTVEKASGGNDPHLWLGTSKTFFEDQGVLTDLTGDSWDIDLTGLVANTLYYYYIEVGASGADFGRTGIYQQRTS